MEKIQTRELDAQNETPRIALLRDAVAYHVANHPTRMSNSLSETISTLNKLIETCKDGQEGFRLAAESIADDENLKSFLFSCSLQRSKFAGELQNELIGLGESGPVDTSSVAPPLCTVAGST